jgi:dTMP kinase
MAGFFLVLEGPEGAGKTTLTEALGRRFRGMGLDPLLVREPGGTPAAEALRQELLHDARTWTPEAELLYMCAARADLVAKLIRPALAAGRVVVSDRFDLSTRAYQGAGRGLPMAHVDWVNRAATGGLTPDLTVVLDVPPEVGAARQISQGKVRDRLDRETVDFHHRVRAAYHQAAGPGLVHLDATVSPEILAASVWKLLGTARPELFGREQAS